MINQVIEAQGSRSSSLWIVGMTKNLGKARMTRLGKDGGRKKGAMEAPQTRDSE